MNKTRQKEIRRKGTSNIFRVNLIFSSGNLFSWEILLVLKSHELCPQPWSWGKILTGQLITKKQHSHLAKLNSNTYCWLNLHPVYESQSPAWSNYKGRFSAFCAYNRPKRGLWFFFLILGTTTDILSKFAIEGNDLNIMVVIAWEGKCKLYILPGVVMMNSA